MPKTKTAKEKPERPQPQRTSTIVVEADPNNPQSHVQAVQSAIDNSPEDGGTTVLLKGTFEFGTAQVIVRGWADISGYGHPQKRAIVHGGSSPFLVDSKDYPVRISGIEFTQPTLCAIEIKSCTGLIISDCAIRQVQVVPTNQPFQTGGGIFGHTTTPGSTVVTNIFGDLEISNNELDVNSGNYTLPETTDRTFGIQIDLALQPQQATPRTVLVAKNIVANVTAHGIALRNLGTTVTGRIEGNQITTGTVGGRSSVQSFVDGIFCQGSGKYVVTNNNPIDCGYENSAGIRLVNTIFTPQVPGIVENNDIIMSAIPLTPDSDTESAGIELRRKCDYVEVKANRISGRASYALSVAAETLIPSHNHFSDNDHAQFASWLSVPKDILVGANADDTFIERGTGGKIDIQPGATRVKIDPLDNYTP